jgi:hypothetical protein
MWRPTDAFNFFKLLVPSGIPNDGKVMYPKLYRLSIVGMNLDGSFGYRTAIFPYFNFANLRHLALYSCPSSALLLKQLARNNVFDNAESPPTFGMGL